jgi:hypothetical protein
MSNEWKAMSVLGFTRYSLLIARYSLLVTHCYT